MNELEGLRMYSDNYADYIYTRITTNGVTHYYRTYLNPNGIWSDGRVDYRTKTEELPLEDWLIEQREEAISYDARLRDLFAPDL